MFFEFDAAKGSFVQRMCQEESATFETKKTNLHKNVKIKLTLGHVYTEESSPKKVR